MKKFIFLSQHTITNYRPTIWINSKTSSIRVAEVEVLRAKLLILRSFFTPYRCSKQALILLQAEEQLNNFNNLWKCFLLKTSLLPQWKWLFTLVEDKSALFMEVQKFISRNLFSLASNNLRNFFEKFWRTEKLF